MEESILKSTKKMLSIGDDDSSFDQDILTHINGAFSHLQQLGIGPAAGYAITDDSDEWVDFLSEEVSTPIISAVKVNVFLQVRLLFDPPASSYVLTAMEKQLQESDVRLNMLRESTGWTNPDPSPVVEDDIFDGGLI